MRFLTIQVPSRPNACSQYCKDAAQPVHMIRRHDPRVTALLVDGRAHLPGPSSARAALPTQTQLRCDHVGPSPTHNSHKELDELSVSSALHFDLDQRARVRSCGGIIVRAKFNRVVLSLLGTDAGPRGRHLASLAPTLRRIAAALPEGPCINCP